MIISEKIILREIEEKDLDLIIKWRNDPKILRWFFSYLPLNKVKQRKWYEKYLNDDTQQTFIIELKEEIPIGTVGLTGIDYKNQRAELTIVIGEKEYGGKGLGKEALDVLVKFAFNEMNLRKIKALVFSDNERAINLYEKYGFIKEGVLKEEIFKDGEFRNIIIFSKFGVRKDG